jgi:DNA-binding MarR family transcriptional regulator
VHLVVGHSHSFDAPVRHLRGLIDSGRYGNARMINAINYTDYLYRPRRPEELDTALGGGAIFNQAAHQIDIVRLLGGGRVASVRAATGAWDRTRPTEGAYAALLTFENGVFASLTYSGYGNFDSDEFQGWIGEMGQKKTPYAAARHRFDNQQDEVAFKNARNYGGPDFRPSAGQDLAHQNFGTLLVSCERADLRALPNGVMVYQNGSAQLDPLPMPKIPRVEVIDELYDAVVMGQPPLHDGAWAMADAGSPAGDPAIVARKIRRAPEPSGGQMTRPSPDTETILRHWREAVPDDRLAHLVKDATRALVRALQMRLAEHSVSFGHWTFLRILWEGDGLTQRELSEQAGVMEPTTFSALNAMERLGYVTRRKRGGDRKKVYVLLTAKGRRLQEKLVPLAEEVNRIAVRGVRSNDIAATRGVLLNIIENLARDERVTDMRMPSTRELAALKPGRNGRHKACAPVRRRLRGLRGAFRGPGALHAKLAFAPDHEKPRAGDDSRTQVDQLLRQFAEQPVAKKQRPQHR